MRRSINTFCDFEQFCGHDRQSTLAESYVWGLRVGMTLVYVELDCNDKARGAPRAFELKRY